MPDQSGSTSAPIDAWQFHEAAGVDDWRVVGEGACAYFRTGSFAAGARLVVAVSELAGLEAAVARDRQEPGARRGLAARTPWTS